MAVATDYNPGTSPFANIHLAMNMAWGQFGLTPEEAGLASRGTPAQALGVAQRTAVKGRFYG